MARKNDLLKKEELAVAVIAIIGLVVVISFFVKPDIIGITGFFVFDGSSEGIIPTHATFSDDSDITLNINASDYDPAPGSPTYVDVRDTEYLTIWNFSGTVPNESTITSAILWLDFGNYYNDIAFEISINANGTWSDPFCFTQIDSLLESCDLHSNGIDTAEEINNLELRITASAIDPEGPFEHFKLDYVHITGEYTICEEDWSCTEWSECVDGTQTRSCIDNNACGSEDDKPAESQNCTVAPESYSYVINSSTENSQLEMETSESINESEVIIEEFASLDVENSEATSANKYINISASINDKLSWSIIKMYYTDEEVANINESTLKIYYLNGNVWEALDSIVVEEENYVWVNVTHFSIYGLFGESLPSEVEESSTNTGDGGSSGGGRGSGSHRAEAPVEAQPQEEASQEKTAEETPAQEVAQESETEVAGAAIKATSKRNVNIYSLLAMVSIVIIVGMVAYIKRKQFK